MAIVYNTNIPKNQLVFLFDVSNPKCVDATQTIDANTRLNNLVGGSLQLQSEQTVSGSLGDMSFVKDGELYVYDQVGTNTSNYPGWKGTETVTAVDDYSFVGWYKYEVGSGNQRVSTNIYGGGLRGRTSFYLSPGGTSVNSGALRYSDVGSANAFTIIGNRGTTDGNWHMFATRDSGPDGNHTCEVYIDGEFVQTATSNASHDTPHGAEGVVWGNWSGGYGHMTGRTNLFMYYNRTLTASEIKQIFNATKGRFGL